MSNPVNIGEEPHLTLTLTLWVNGALRVHVGDEFRSYGSKDYANFMEGLSDISDECFKFKLFKEVLGREKLIEEAKCF